MTHPAAIAPEPSGSARDSDSENLSEDTTDAGAEEFVFRGREVTAAAQLLTPKAQRKRKQVRQRPFAATTACYARGSMSCTTAGCLRQSRLASVRRLVAVVQVDSRVTASSAKRSRAGSSPATPAPRRLPGSSMPSMAKQSGSGSQADGVVSREEFVQMQREVQRLGACPGDTQICQTFALRAAQLCVMWCVVAANI